MQLPRCARGLVSTQPRYCPFPVTSLQRAIKSSRAACRGSANSQALQDPSQEAPAKLQGVVAEAAAAAAAKAKEKFPAGHRAPGYWPQTHNFYGLHCDEHPLSPKSSRSIKRCFPASGRGNRGCKQQQVPKGRGLPLPGTATHGISFPFPSQRGR